MNGSIELEVVKKKQICVAKRAFYQKSSKLSPAIYLDNSGAICFYMIHIGGGIAQNESYELSVKVAKNAHLTLLNLASTYIYKCENDNKSYQNGNFFVDEFATLELNSDSLILFENANFNQNFNFFLKESSNLIFCEIITSKDKESPNFTLAKLRSKFFINEELQINDLLILSPKNIKNLGFLENQTYIANLYFISPKATKALKEALDKHIKNHIKKLDINFGISLNKSTITLRALSNSADSLKFLIQTFQNYIRCECLGLQELNIRKY